MFALGDGWDDFLRAWIADGSQDCGIYRVTSSRDLFFGATRGDGVFQAKHPRMQGTVLFSCPVESGTFGVVPVEAIPPETLSRIGASHHFETFAAQVVCRWRAPASGQDHSVSNPFVHFCEFWIGEDIYLQATIE